VIGSIAPLAAGNAFLMVATSRFDAALGWLGRCNVDRLPLRPLDLESARALLDGLLGVSPDLDELKQRVLRHTGGIPLFIEEVIRRLIETKVVTRTRGRLANYKSGQDLGIPPTIQGVIASRIDRLSKSGKSLLQLAAAIGPIVAVRLLAAVTATREEKLLAQLAKLESAGFLVVATAFADPSYEFPHALIREVAYETMLREHRKGLHQLILKAIESLSGVLEGNSVEALAHHSEQAEAWEKVDHYAHRAAQRALAHSAFREATHYFEVTMEAVDRLPPSLRREARAVDLRVEARMAFAAFGQMDRWLALAQEAERRAAMIKDAERQLAAAAVRAAALNFCGALPDAIKAGTHALKQAEQLGTTSWLSYTEYGLAQAYFTAGQFRKTERLLERACARLTSAPDDVPIGTTGPSLLVLCCMTKAISHTALGELDRADVYEQQASRIASVSNRPYDRIASGYCHGVVRLVHGDVDAASEALSDALEVSRRNEVRQFVPVVMCQLGNSYLQQEHPGQARAVLEEARSEAATLGHTASFTFGVCLFGLDPQYPGRPEQRDGDGEDCAGNGTAAGLFVDWGPGFTCAGEHSGVPAAGRHGTGHAFVVYDNGHCFQDRSKAVVGDLPYLDRRSVEPQRRFSWRYCTIPSGDRPLCGDENDTAARQRDSRALRLRQFVAMTAHVQFKRR